MDCLQIDNLVYILLEHASSGSLFPYINQVSGLPEPLALRFLYQTALGVKYLHDKKIIHRDIKPENLLLDDGFNVKMCDFGWSCVLEDNQVRESLCGTYEYMPPEILNEGTHTSKVDIWCLGILFFEMLHGYSPFPGNSINEVKHKIKNKPLWVKEGVSEFSKDLVSKLLNKDSDKRISVDELLSLIKGHCDVEEFMKPIAIEHYEQLLNNYYEYKYKVSAHLQENGHQNHQTSQPQETNPKTVTVKIVDEQGVLKLVQVPIPPNIPMIEEKICMITRFNIEEFEHSAKSKKMRRNSETSLGKIRSVSSAYGDYLLALNARDTFLSRVIVRNAIEGRMSFHPSGKIIVLERKMDWRRDFYELESQFGIAGAIFFVIYFDPLLSGFVIEAVPFPNEKNVVRKLLKRDFRARPAAELKVITNLEDFKVCHVTGIFGVTNTLLSAILVADLSL